MNRYERLNAMLEIVAGDGQIDVPAAARRLDVSQVTVRRDLDHLARQQLLTRTRGGAVASNVSYDLPMRYKAAKHAPQKLRIGEAASGLVTRGMVVALTGGTTTTETAQILAARADIAQGAGGEPALTIVTNALNIASELVVRPQVKTVLTGGVPRAQSFELIGPLATKVLDEITLDLAVLGVNGVDPQYGATASHEGEASINRLMAERAHRTVVLADTSKLGQRAFAQICTVDLIDVLVTDQQAPEDLVAAFRDHGVEVVLA